MTLIKEMQKTIKIKSLRKKLVYLQTKKNKINMKYLRTKKKRINIYLKKKKQKNKVEAEILIGKGIHFDVL